MTIHTFLYWSLMQIRKLPGSQLLVQPGVQPRTPVH